MKNTKVKEAVILFAGDSGDGIQLAGNQFSQTSALEGNDISTFPDFPAEIRAPQGTLSGVSGFQLHFSSENIFSPGDSCDVLVAMNAAAFEMNFPKLKKNGIIISNSSGFDARNLRLARLDKNPLEDLPEGYKNYSIDLTQNTLEALKDLDLPRKSKERCKNMYALGFVYWLYSKDIEYTLDYLQKKFGKESLIFEANAIALKEGYKYGEITDTFTERFEVDKADFPKGEYRSISGNGAIVLGLMAASVKAQKDIFFAGYPITPASDILQFLSRYKSYGVKSFQAEDEIAAITSAIGASFAGDIGVTASSGPGIALKSEAMGLAFMLELPLVIINVQRGGPSTGLPTKTEQSDLMQVMYGRNGEAPIPVIAAQSPTDAFYAAFNAVKMALEHNTPVILLSDGYIANGAEPWKIPLMDELPEINAAIYGSDKPYLPYERDENEVRKVAQPGTANNEHVLGGLEKSNETGEVSYDAENHQLMVNLRAKKVQKIADFYPTLEFENKGNQKKLLILSWGSTYGSVKAAVTALNEKGETIDYISLKNIFPFPKELKEILSQYEKIFIPELNMGQLQKLIQQEFQVECISFHKVKGVPFTANEIMAELEKHL